MGIALPVAVPLNLSNFLLHCASSIGTMHQQARLSTLQISGWKYLQYVSIRKPTCALGFLNYYKKNYFVNFGHFPFVKK